MDVVVTGSSGLIGTALTASLRAAGHRPIRMVRVTAEDRSGTDTIHWDPPNGVIDSASLEGVDAIVHLAGAGIGDKRWSPARKEEIRTSRTKSTALLAEAIAGLDTRPAVFLSGSAIGFYGDRGDEVLTEESSPGTGFLTDVVTQWEAAAAMAVEAGVRTAFLRTGVVLSKNGGALAKQLPLFRFGLGGKMGSGRQWLSWISIDDEVRAIEFLLTNDIAGPVNLTAPTPVTNAEFTKALGAVLGRPTVLPIPSFGPKLLLGGELAQNLLFSGQRVEPRVLTAAGYPFAHPTLDAALRSILGKPAAA